MEAAIDVRPRKNHLPLYLSPDIYALVEDLQRGYMLPPEIYLMDYENEFIPPWSIIGIERHGDLIILTLVDLSTQGLYQDAHRLKESYVGCDLFCLPERTLKTKNFLYFDGCIHARHLLGDVRQHARQVAEKMLGKKRGSLSPDVLEREEGETDHE